MEDKTVAILPVEVILTGKLPKNMTEQQKATQEQYESKFYQELLHSKFLDKSRSAKKNKYGVHFINPQDVNSKLAKANINYSNLKEKSTEELATITGSDMILFVNIKKQRLMSDGAAIGLDIVESVINSVINPSGQNNTTNTTQKTHNISFAVTLIDGKTGTTISKLSDFKEANWQESPEIVLKRNYARTTRKLPVFALD